MPHKFETIFSDQGTHKKYGTQRQKILTGLYSLGLTYYGLSISKSATLQSSKTYLLHFNYHLDLNSVKVEKLFSL